MTDRDVARYVRWAREELRDFALSREERAQEVEALAQVFADGAAAQLENLEHRRPTARGDAE